MPNWFRMILWSCLLVTVLGAGKCDPKQINVREACAILNETLWRDGSFTLNDAEIDALREVTQVKIDSVKRFYRKQCALKAQP